MPLPSNVTEISTPLLNVVQNKLIPRAQQFGLERVVLARKNRRELHLPTEVGISSAGKLGKRVAVRESRFCGNVHIVTAHWPMEGQETLRVPMLWCVAAGQARLRLGEYILHLNEGYSVLIPPGVPHPRGTHHYHPVNEFCDAFIIRPSGRQLQCWLTRHRNGTVKQSENLCTLSETPVDDLDRLTEEMTHGGTNAKAIGHHLLCTLWLTLQRELEMERFVNILPVSPGEANGTLSYDPVVRAQHYIQAHLTEKLTLEIVAQAVHLSRSQFNRLFHQRTGQTLVEYVNRLRLQWACQLLKESDWTVCQISRFTGFKATPYFYRTFGDKMGMTPLEYRHHSRRQPGIFYPETPNEK